MAKKISDAVLEVLAAARMEGSALFLHAQLPRALYAEANKVLVAAGGKWSKGKKAHLFDGDAADAVDQIVLAGEVSDLKRDFQCFFSPPAVVARVAAAAHLAPNLYCLEPSAGEGAIVGAMLAHGDLRIHAVEIRPELAGKLPELRLGVHVGDFLAVEPVQGYDRVLMNPPFARGAEVRHVTHALRFLRPGGRLVAVMSTGVTFRTDGLYAGFRDLVDRHDGSITPLPDESFKASGTGVSTVLVTLAA